MTTALLLVALVVVFIVGVFWPHKAGKIQKETDKDANWLKRLSNWFWNPATWITKKGINANQQAIDKSADLGKKTRKKVKKTVRP